MGSVYDRQGILRVVSAEVRILNAPGLHARPASKLVSLISRSKAEVTLMMDGERVNARSILNVISLQALQGATITVEVTGEGEIELLEEIIELIRNKFGVEDGI